MSGFKETQDILRLYRREWVTVHTVTMALTDTGGAEPCVLAARQWRDENLDGRVDAKDVILQANTDNSALVWVHVRVFKDNLKGEFKDRAAAEAYALANGFDTYTVVVRNSKHDHEIRSYGVKKL